MLIGSPFRYCPQRALYRAQRWVWKPTFDQFLPQLVGMVKKGGREVVEIPGLVAVLPVLQILLDDSNKIGIAEQSAADTIER